MRSPHLRSWIPTFLCALLLILAAGIHFSSPAEAKDPTAVLAELFAEVPPGTAPSGVLYDRVLSLSGIEELDGGVYASAATLARWRQAYFEIRRAADDGSRLPTLDQLRERTQQWQRDRGPGVEEIPIAVLDYAFDRLREDAFEQGKASVTGGKLRLNTAALKAAHVFTAAPLREVSYRGREVEFTFPPEYFFANQSIGPERHFLDADDGQGLREVPRGTRLRARYEESGGKRLRVSAAYADGTVRNAFFEFTVKALAAPAPDDTLQLTASIGHAGGNARGEAYLYYAPGRNELVQPILLIEGFDLDNSLDWDEVYELLNTENLLEDMRNAGFDVVLLNFEDATDLIQRNSYLVVELIQQIQERIDPRARFTLAGASMGGLCSRFALAYMEQNGLPHRVNTFISFDAPHGGASIPLGLQHWLDFFSGESEDAAFLLSRLDRPAARQLLVYHHASSLPTKSLADPLRANFLAELASLGDYPSQPRLVAIANGSGMGQSQGFVPGEQIIRWEYDDFFANITGNVWAVGDGPNTRIFEGDITILFIPVDNLEVYVSGTDPFDSAPGGSRASMAQAGDTEAPYGDIIALHASHCFIPTISALDLPTDDLFFDVATDGLTAPHPFDAIYWPTVNQEHVQVTAENAEWIKAELFGSPTSSDAAPLARTGVRLHQNMPNPFNPSTTIRFEAFEAGPARLDVYDLRGRRVVTLVNEFVEVGDHSVVWDGRDSSGRAVGSGTYFARLMLADVAEARRMALVR